MVVNGLGEDTELSTDIMLIRFKVHSNPFKCFIFHIIILPSSTVVCYKQNITVTFGWRQLCHKVLMFQCNIMTPLSFDVSLGESTLQSQDPQESRAHQGVLLEPWIYIFCVAMRDPYRWHPNIPRAELTSYKRRVIMGLFTMSGNCFDAGQKSTLLDLHSQSVNLKSGQLFMTICMWPNKVTCRQIYSSSCLLFRSLYQCKMKQWSSKGLNCNRK